jgi:dienelactone hydrolase
VLQQKVGEGAQGYWLYLPADPTPQSAPVVLFLHGWRAMNPVDYAGWIEHMTRRGNIVIYPIFEDSRSDTPDQIMSAAINATKTALANLRSTGITPDLARFAIVGHSFGGGLTTQIAARAASAGLPKPKAIMPTQPGWRGNDAMPTDRLREIPADVLMLLVIGDNDQFAKTRQTKPIWDATAHVKNRRYVVLQSDAHGTPPLIADHAAPLSPREGYGEPITRAQARRRGMVEAITGMREGEIDALDYYGFWRLFDLLTDAAFAGQSIDAVVAQAGMGVWSDGAPVKPMLTPSGP